MKILENELMIFETSELEKLKGLKYLKYDQEKRGYLYILKYTSNCDKDIIKIGVTINPYQRISSLIKTTNNYGFSSVEKIAITYPHSNYYKSERNMQEYYASKRNEGCEVFNVSFDDACSMANKLLSTKINYIVEYNKTSLNCCVNLNSNLIFAISKDCTPMAIAVYFSILSHYNTRLKYSCMSYEDISNEINMDKDSVCKYVNNLKDFGYIIIKNEDADNKIIKNSQNVYYLTYSH